MKFEKMIENAKMASMVWNDRSPDDRAKIAKYFHLRPTNSGVTLVSTMPFLPMRGITAKDEKKLRWMLDYIISEYNKIVSTDIKVATNILVEKLGMKERGTSKSHGEEGVREESVQASMIRNMKEDLQLPKIFKVENISFIASELIFERNAGRLDIVGFADSKLLFFELKKDRTTKVEQLTGYRDYFSRNIHNLRQLLENYPINPVKKFDENIECAMVMRFAENSKREKWIKIAEDNGIHIIFYKESLAFQKP